MYYFPYAGWRPGNFLGNLLEAFKLQFPAFRPYVMYARFHSPSHSRAYYPPTRISLSVSLAGEFFLFAASPDLYAKAKVISEDMETEKRGSMKVKFHPLAKACYFFFFFFFFFFVSFLYTLR
jgi:hypothetical protein